MKKVLPVILILIGIILLSTPFLTEQIIKYHSKSLVSEEISMEKIRSNIKSDDEKVEELEFNFSVIQDVDI